MTMRLRFAFCPASLSARVVLSLLVMLIVPMRTVLAAETAPITLPGGATSLQETFGDWRVVCVVAESVKRCSLIQEQVNQQSRQRVLAVEISSVGHRLEGALLLPFGLALDRGVVLQINDEPDQPPLRFRTCLPGGCLVPLSLDSKMVTALRAGTSLKTKAVADGGQAQFFAVSLKGFGQALDRISILSR